HIRDYPTPQESARAWPGLIDRPGAELHPASRSQSDLHTEGGRQLHSKARERARAALQSRYGGNASRRLRRPGYSHFPVPSLPQSLYPSTTGSPESTDRYIAAIQQRLRLRLIMIWPSSITKVAADRPTTPSQQSQQQRHPRIPERSFSELSRGIRMLDPERILHVGHT